MAAIHAQPGSHPNQHMCFSATKADNSSMWLLQASFLMQRPVGGRFLIQPLGPTEPVKDCMVCGTAQLQLTLNAASMTLDNFINKVCTHLLRRPATTICLCAMVHH